MFLLALLILVLWMAEPHDDTLQISTNGVDWVDYSKPQWVSNGENYVIVTNPGIFRVRRTP